MKVELSTTDLSRIRFALSLDLQTVADNPDDWEGNEFRELERLFQKINRLIKQSTNKE